MYTDLVAMGKIECNHIIVFQPFYYGCVLSLLSGYRSILNELLTVTIDTYESFILLPHLYFHIEFHTSIAVEKFSVFSESL